MSSKNKTHINKPWTKTHINKFNWLFNWYIKTHDEEANKNNFIDENKNKLINLILNEKWKDTSKEGLLFMVSRYLFNKNNSDKYIKLYAQEGYNLKLKKDNEEGKNELDDKEKDNYRTIEYLNNCLELHESQANDNIKEHYKHLLLMMLIKQPPLRTSFYTTAKFLRLQADNNKNDNYIYITRKGKMKVYYIVNKDKATNYKLYNINKNLSKIKIDNDELEKFIYNSFVLYPRLYLFEINKKPISENTILKYLREITQTPLINIDMLRSAYITNFYKNNMTFNEREALSHKMRHSQQTASKNYLKVSNIEKITPDEKIKELTKENITLNKLIYECQTKIKTLEKTPENEKEYNKKRNDILYLLNKGRTSKPETITKYKILHDDKTNKYY
jgi:hypothetical protein